MAAKYQTLIKEMYQTHAKLMNDFEVVHQKYEGNQKKFQNDFNVAGAKVLEVMRDYERMLCGKSERSGMGVYSSKLAEKFWSEIKQRFSMIDFVGAKIS